MTPGDMTLGDAETGLPDHLYDLVLLLQLAAWLEELAQSDREIVQRAKRMLSERLRSTTS